MISASATVITAASTSGGMSKALTMLSDSVLICTIGSRNPQATMVTTANSHAYHFWPIAFSM